MGVDVTTYRIRIGCCRNNCGSDVAIVTVTVDIAMTLKSSCAVVFLLLTALGLLALLHFSLESVHYYNFTNNAKVTMGVFYTVHCLCRGRTALSEIVIGAVVCIRLLLLAAGIEPNPGPEHKNWESRYGTKQFALAVYVIKLSDVLVGITNNYSLDKDGIVYMIHQTGYNVQGTFFHVYSLCIANTHNRTMKTVTSRTCSFLLGNKGTHMTHGNPHSKGDVKLHKKTTLLLEEKVHRSVGLIRVEILNEKQKSRTKDGLWTYGTGFRVGDCYMITAYHVLYKRIEFLIDNIVKTILRGGYTNVEELLLTLDMPHSEPHEHIRTVIKSFLTANGMDIPLLLSRLGNSIPDEFKGMETALWKKHCVVEFLDTPRVKKYDIDWRITFGSEERDILIVKLLETTDHQTMPPKLYLAKTYKNNDKMFLVRYINENEPKVVLDQEIKVFVDDEELKEAVTSSLEWWRSNFPDKEDFFNYEDCTKAHNTNTGRVIIRAAESFTYGSSGSPVVYLQEHENPRQVFVGMIFQRGFPIFYYDKEMQWNKLIHEKLSEPIKNDVLFEGCTTMQTLAELLMGHGKQNLMANIFSTKVAACDFTEETRRRIIDTWEEEENRFFVETKATRHITNRLRKSNILTIVGCAGSGKSVAMHHAALTLKKEEFSLSVIKTCFEVYKTIQEGKRQICLIDDPIGDYAIDKQKLSEWQENSIYIKACMTGYTKLVVTIHKEIFNIISSLSDLIFNIEVIDLNSMQLRMSPLDRLIYFEGALDKRLLETNTASLSEMVQACELQNFPLLVHTYFSDKYFVDHPSHLFEDFVGAFELRLQKMCEFNKEQFAGLVLCSANQGNLKVETFDRFLVKDTTQTQMCKQLLLSLDISSPLHRIGDELNKLEGIYITKTSEYYTFKHCEFGNVVTYLIAKKYETFIVTYFNATFCLKRCQLSRKTNNFYSSISKGNKNDIIDHRHSITITENMESHLAVAFIKAMSGNKDLMLPLFTSDFCQDEKFLKILHTEAKNPELDIHNDYKGKLMQQILCNASLNNFGDLIDELVHEDIRYNDHCSTGLTLTAAYAYAGNSSQLKILIDNGYDVNLESKGLTPLGFAVLNNQMETAECLLSFNCDVDLGYHTPLSISASNCDEQTLNFLLDNGATVNKLDGDGLSPLANALHSEEITKLLIKRSADMNMFGQVENALTPLSAACITGKENIVKILLENKVEVNTIDGTGNTALTSSIIKGYYSLARLLIQDNANVNLKGAGDKATTPLCAACKKGHALTVEFLLRKKAHINTYCRDGSTPLTWAISESNTDVVDILLRQKADVNLCGDGVKALTPLTAASLIGLEHIVLRLLSEGANINQCNGAGRAPLTQAIIANKIAIVIFLLDKKPDVNTCGNGNKALTPLTAASAIGSTFIIKSLLSLDADINKYDGTGKTPLTQAVLRNDVDIVKYLLKNDANVNTCGNGDEAFTPLTAASLKGSVHIVDFMLTKGAYIDQFDGIGRTPLTSAILSKKEYAMEFLLNKEANVNICGNGDRALTPLTAASEIGSVGIVNRLFHKGADINFCDGMGRTPLTRAISSGRRIVIDFLLNEKADVNICGISNNALTPLTAASMIGSMEIVELLHEKGADINKFDGSGKTPLTQAICTKNTDICKYLLDKNADVQMHGEGKNALSPLTAASRTGSVDMVKLLIQKKADINKYDGLGRTPLTTAILRDDANEINFFLKMKANVNSCGNKDEAFTPLTAASYIGSIELMTQLLKAGADINKLDGKKITPLTQAIIASKIDAIHFLLKYKADINLCGNGYQAFTPLTASCSIESLDIVNIVINEGAEINKLDGMHHTPMSSACERGSIDVVKLLLTNGADINGNQKNNVAPLIAAIKRGAIEIIECLLNKGANINHRYSRGLYPLIVACRTGFTEIVKLLIDRGANVDNQDTISESPLIAACKVGSEDIVKLLLQNGANIHDQGRYINSPLNVACELGFVKIVELLLIKGARINRYDQYSRSPLFVASNRGYENIVELLLEKGANVNAVKQNYPDGTPLLTAIENKYCDIVKLLLNKGANVNMLDINGESPLIAACKAGSIKSVKLLLHKGANINHLNTNGKSPLIAACEMGSLEIVHLLLNKRTNVNLHYRKLTSALIAASKNGCDDIVEILLNKGAEINMNDIKGESPLIAACKTGSVRSIESLLLKGARINHHSTSGSSPLSTACELGSAEIVKLLLHKGAKVNLHYQKITTALIAASKNGYCDIVEILLNKGAYINMNDVKGESPLIAACKAGCVKSVELLLFKGARINHHSTSGNSPLSIACEEGSAEIVKLLLHEGAHVNPPYQKCSSALIAACKNGNWSIVEILLDKGADSNMRSIHGETSLGAASKAGSAKSVELLLRKGTQVNQCDGNKRSPLIAASKAGYKDVVELLLDNGANVNQSDKDGISPLIAAITIGDVGIVEFLLSKGALINQHDTTRSPLVAACIKGSVEIVKRLLHKGATVNQLCSSGISPLAAANINKEIIELLLDKGGDVNQLDCWSKSPLIYACEHGYGDIVKFLLQKGASINNDFKYRISFLVTASLAGWVEVVNILLNKGENVQQIDYMGISPLTAACCAGSINIVDLLVLKGAEVNLEDGNGRSPIVAAIESGHVEIVNCLLHKGALINKETQRINSPLFVACERGCFDVFELLIKEGANVNDCDRYGFGLSSLIVACRNGSLEMVKLLLQKGAQINKNNECRFSPLIAASEAGSVEIVELLVHNGANVNQCDSIGKSALNSSNVEIIKLLLGKGAKLNQDDICNHSPLVAASEEGYVEIVEMLLYEGAHVNQRDNRGMSPLFAACINGHIEIVELLLRKGADVNRSHFRKLSPLLASIKNGSVEIVEHLLEGSIINAHEHCSETALVEASKVGSVEIVEILLRKGAKVNQQDRIGNAPLIVACTQGYTNIVQVLLNSGANVNKRNKVGTSPLIAACENGIEEIIEMLLNKGSKVNHFDKDGRSPVFIASENRNEKIIELLLNKGANIDQHDERGRSPLFNACRHGYEEIVELLLDNGADINKADDKCRSPLYVANKNGHETICEILSKGKNINQHDDKDFNDLA